MTHHRPAGLHPNDKQPLAPMTLIAIADDAIDEGDFALATRFIEWAYQAFDETEINGKAIIAGVKTQAA